MCSAGIHVPRMHVLVTLNRAAALHFIGEANKLYMRLGGTSKSWGISRYEGRVLCETSLGVVCRAASSEKVGSYAEHRRLTDLCAVLAFGGGETRSDIIVRRRWLFFLL